ncbi:MAG TPA: hypothetical protein VHD32_05850 [Candidatus Didemnitutus sp.]|nr:hypothetical protein [Candidatus Didemnitutus sp.]
MKRLVGFGSVVLGTILMCGCQMAVHDERAPEPAPTPVEKQAAVIVREPDNTITHPASGMRFPERVADFQRENFSQTGRKGLNFQCDYRLSGPGALVLATVTMYPAPSATGATEGIIHEARPGLAESEYQLEVKQILAGHPNTVVSDEKEFALAQGMQKHVGRMAEFQYSDTIEGRFQPVVSRLYLFNNVDEKWAVRFRITFPKGATADRVISEFLSSLHWSLKEE